MAEVRNIEIKEIDKFEVIPVQPGKKKGLVKLLAIPGPTSEGTTFAAGFELEGQPNSGGFITKLVCPWYTRTPEEREQSEKAYRKRVDAYFLSKGYTIKDKKFFLNL